MNPLLEVLCNEITKIKKMLTTTGTDYTATVTRVDGNTAYVQMSGSEISDTPVSMTINANVGDKVRVRVSNGRAWITGNDTAPPSDDSKSLQEIAKTNAMIDQRKEAEDGRYSVIEQTVDQITLEVGEVETKADNAQTTANGRMKSDMSNKASSITIGSGQIAFNSNTLVVNSSKFQLDANGNATFSGNLSAAGGTFSGNLSAAGGTFNGAMSVSANTPTGTVQAYICERNGSGQVPYSIRIVQTFSNQSGASYETIINGDGITVQSKSGSTVTASTEISNGGVSVSSGGSTTSVVPSGVSGPSGSRLIASSEVSKLNNYPTSPPEKWGSPVKWSHREDSYEYTLASGSYHWYVLTKPTDTNYNWYLINAVADENAVWVLHTSQTGAYMYNHGSDRYTNLYITGYWLGIHV